MGGVLIPFIKKPNIHIENKTLLFSENSCTIGLIMQKGKRKEGGKNMFEAINSFVTSVNNVVWGWAMIILLFGTHVFLTIPHRIHSEKDDYKRNQAFHIQRSGCGRKRYHNLAH